MKLWLDDIREAPEGWIWVKTPAEFWRALGHVKLSEVEAISFDNDLGENQSEGWEIAKDLLELFISQPMLRYAPVMDCHSANVAARPRIEGYINDIYRVVGDIC